MVHLRITYLVQLGSLNEKNSSLEMKINFWCVSASPRLRVSASPRLF
ncbi:MAG: hypothetical protein F6K41_16470 [Symploca sp. SIO3E6]|nr:hypothetical protein [Caldora sp. SIO3E6]